MRNKWKWKEKKKKYKIKLNYNTNSFAEVLVESECRVSIYELKIRSESKIFLCTYLIQGDFIFLKDKKYNLNNWGILFNIGGAKLPFTIVENASFKEFVRKLNPTYELPDNTTIQLFARNNALFMELDSTIPITWGNLVKKVVSFVTDKASNAANLAELIFQVELEFSQRRLRLVYLVVKPYSLRKRYYKSLNKTPRYGQNKLQANTKERKIFLTSTSITSLRKSTNYSPSSLKQLIQLTLLRTRIQTDRPKFTTIKSKDEGYSLHLKGRIQSNARRNIKSKSDSAKLLSMCLTPHACFKT
ncbi:hypothetical protein BpHYR1_029796 [Brachionus plicatilis]|uniref:Uncharacterized protein n=1 Tax=Brachionus plicatilis TaxID=10195 RepID=A0A3M7T4X0_BRAPC|nr:hypothetical protein BpHYR1_029796 [Brachionus plicatilis]